MTVYTRIYAGNGTDGDVVREGKGGVDNLGSGRSSSATKRVELSMADTITAQNGTGGSRSKPLPVTW